MTRLAHSTSNEPQVLDEHGLAAVTLSVNWLDQRAHHEEQLHVEKLSVWREADTLPPEIGQHLPGLRAGDELQASLPAGKWLEPWQLQQQITTRPSRFDRHHRRGLEVTPRLGRFYPQGFLQGVQGIFKDAVTPARITELTPDSLQADLNHPLARFPLQVKLHLDQVLPGFDQRGGRCTSPLDDLLQYPGLAAPLADGQLPDYGDDNEGLSRMDERPDALFYAKPRPVQHLDSRALETINALYRRQIPRLAKVLDLMASHDSHLQHVYPASLHLLGMNAEELAGNRAAHHWAVQDLNATPDLSYESGSLDAVVCTASIEYLLQPQAVLAEALRVLRPGGVLIISFSNRWFPSKAIRLWGELHEFERVGLVCQWLQQAGFSQLNTYSARGWPRPGDDPHAARTPYSDPVYAVWGSKPTS